MFCATVPLRIFFLISSRDNIKRRSKTIAVFTDSICHFIILRLIQIPSITILWFPSLPPPSSRRQTDTDVSTDLWRETRSILILNYYNLQLQNKLHVRLFVMFRLKLSSIFFRNDNFYPHLKKKKQNKNIVHVNTNLIYKNSKITPRIDIAKLSIRWMFEVFTILLIYKKKTTSKITVLFPCFSVISNYRETATIVINWLSHCIKSVQNDTKITLHPIVPQRPTEITVWPTHTLSGFLLIFFNINIFVVLLKRLLKNIFC